MKKKHLFILFLILLIPAVALPHHITVQQDGPGRIAISPGNEVESGIEVTILATPEISYQLEPLTAWKTNDPNVPVEIREIDNAYQFTMPDFDVTVSVQFTLLLPTIATLLPPEAICAGEALELIEPETGNTIDTTGWQLSNDDSFSHAVTYVGQALDESYNGWKLRFMAANSSGIAYSNTVTISIIKLALTLSGDDHVCSNTEAAYHAEGTASTLFQWNADDPGAVIIPNGQDAVVLWSTNAGMKQLTVIGQDTETGCIDSLSISIEVTSHLLDLQPILSKKKGATTYLLFYPNAEDLPYKYQWYRNDSLINCTKQYYYVPESEGGIPAGNYKVYVSLSEDGEGNLFCGAFSPECVVGLPVTGLELSIYPNPLHPNESATVINDNDGPSMLSIYSTDGRLVHQQIAQSGKSNISLNLSPGVYFAQLRDEKGVKTAKLIINNL